MPSAKTRLSDEWKLLFAPGAHKLRDERVEHWYVHATLYASMETQPANPAVWSPLWKEKRISFLFAHLTIVDSKLGKLLTFNQLLLAAMTFLFVTLYNLAKNPPPADHGFRIVLGVVLALTTLVFGALWLVITSICLWGELHLILGDLGRFKDGTRITRAQTSDQTLWLRAEEEQVEELIRAVIRRTSKFRVASQLTGVNFAILPFAYFIGFLFCFQANQHLFLTSSGS